MEKKIIHNVKFNFQFNGAIKHLMARHEKTNVLVSDLVRHKPGCTATEDG